MCISTVDTAVHKAINQVDDHQSIQIIDDVVDDVVIDVALRAKTGKQLTETGAWDRRHRGQALESGEVVGGVSAVAGFVLQ